MKQEIVDEFHVFFSFTRGVCVCTFLGFCLYKDYKFSSLGDMCVFMTNILYFSQFACISIF